MGVTERVYSLGTPVSTPLVLSGEIRNFSTESRWIIQAHVSGTIRLYDQEDALLLEKQVSARARSDEPGNPWFEKGEPLENLLNAAVERWVRAVVTDPDVTQRLVMVQQQRQ